MNPATVPDPASGEESIKTMKLYTDIERIDNELRGMGINDGANIEDPRVLSKIDSMHYEGDDAILAGIQALGLDSASKVLDVGSGFGGPARLIAMEAQSSVVAMEIQADIHLKAQELTNRCNLHGLVHHRQGSILEDGNSDLGTGSYCAVVSWLVFLHISDKAALFKRCCDMLKPEGGKLFADDFFMLREFSPEQKVSLQRDVFCSDLPTREEYIKHLEASGFRNVRFEDRTERWTTFCSDRLRTFVADRGRFESVHGKPTYDRLLHFYTAVLNLFQSGNLGGVRICAEKKSAGGN